MFRPTPIHFAWIKTLHMYVFNFSFRGAPNRYCACWHKKLARPLFITLFLIRGRSLEIFLLRERPRCNFRLNEHLPGNDATAWMTYGDGVESVRRPTPTWSASFVARLIRLSQRAPDRLTGTGRVVRRSACGWLALSCWVG